MTRDTTIGIVIHSLVTGLLILAAMQGAASANGEVGYWLPTSGRVLEPASIRISQQGYR